METMLRNSLLLESVISSKANVHAGLESSAANSARVRTISTSMLVLKTGEASVFDIVIVFEVGESIANSTGIFSQ